MMPSDWSRRNLALSLSIAMIVAATLLLSHPFTGVRHDGTLYAGEALARLLPGEFHDDLYFRYGSQGRFTILPAAYAALIAALGLGTGTIVGMLAAFGLYLGATASLVACLAPKPLRLACVLTVVLGWTLYGGLRMFGYSEAFLTARSFAEPFVLFGLAAFARDRRFLCAASLAIGVAIHPLIGIAGVMVVWLLLVYRDRRWLWPAAAIGVAAMLLGWLAQAPFADLFTRYDPVWLNVVEDVNSQAFVATWSMHDYGVIAFNLATLWFVARLVDGGRLRSFVIAGVVAGLGSTLVSLVAVDLLHNPFFGKLQIWRALWIMQWMAMATLPLACAALWKRGEHGRIAAFLLAMGWMAPFTIVPGVIAILAVSIDAARTRIRITPTTTRLVGGIAVVAAAAIVIQYEARVFKFGVLFGQEMFQVVGQALAMNLLLFGGALLIVRVLPRLGLAAPLVALLVLVGSLATWDQRASWTRTLESASLDRHIWPGLIEPDATVYWYRDLIAPWVLLGHGNYYTQQQGSGAVFSRDLVIELERRRKITGILDFQEQVCRMMNNLSEKQGSCEPDAEAVKTVCEEGKIDYVVLQSSLDGAHPIASYATGVVENGYEKTLFLYRCSALKARS